MVQQKNCSGGPSGEQCVSIAVASGVPSGWPVPSVLPSNMYCVSFSSSVYPQNQAKLKTYHVNSSVHSSTGPKCVSALSTMRPTSFDISSSSLKVASVITPENAPLRGETKSKRARERQKDGGGQRPWEREGRGERGR